MELAQGTVHHKIYIGNKVEEKCNERGVSTWRFNPWPVGITLSCYMKSLQEERIWIVGKRIEYIIKGNVCPALSTSAKKKGDHPSLTSRSRRKSIIYLEETTYVKVGYVHSYGINSLICVNVNQGMVRCTETEVHRK